MNQFYKCRNCIKISTKNCKDFLEKWVEELRYGPLEDSKETLITNKKDKVYWLDSTLGGRVDKTLIKKKAYYKGAYGRIYFDDIVEFKVYTECIPVDEGNLTYEMIYKQLSVKELITFTRDMKENKDVQ